jgi:hypothetical protein
VADRSRSHPGDIAAARYFQVVVGRELARRDLIKQFSLNPLFVRCPVLVLQRRDIEENQVPILGIKPRRIIGVERVPCCILGRDKFLIHL